MCIRDRPTDLNKAQDAIAELIPDVNFDIMEDTMLPNEYVELEGEDLKLFQRCLLYTSPGHVAAKDLKNMVEMLHKSLKEE